MGKYLASVLSLWELGKKNLFGGKEHFPSLCKFHILRQGWRFSFHFSKSGNINRKVGLTTGTLGQVRLCGTEYANEYEQEHV